MTIDVSFNGQKFVVRRMDRQESELIDKFVFGSLNSFFTNIDGKWAEASLLYLAIFYHRIDDTRTISIT